MQSNECQGEVVAAAEVANQGGAVVMPLAEAVLAISCTRDSHAADKSDDATWQTWRLLGRQGDLELRDCPRCGSTLGRAVRP